MRPGKGDRRQGSLAGDSVRIQTLGQFKFSPQALCFTLDFILAGGGEGVVRDVGREALSSQDQG